MRGPEEWPSRRSNPADRIRLKGPAATFSFSQPLIFHLGFIARLELSKIVRRKATDIVLMGLISPAEVPDFFILRNLVPAGKDANGHPIFKADRTKVTIQDVIAAEVPRLPDVDHSQRRFNTGIVVVVENGKNPSPELVERADAIRKQWIEYFETTTGHRTVMTASPQ